MNLFSNIYKGKKVLLTGHSGFKGSWLALWLNSLGADVLGFSLDFPSNPNHFQLLQPNISSVVGDIRDKELLKKTFSDFKPEIVFHLAAQSLVRHSYSYPLETFEINIIGTANVFEAARNCASVKAIVNVTSDKCYENKEDDIACKEDDRMGGYDPYSASKGCAELIVNSYRSSFFKNKQTGKSWPLLASVRAGNVIGGGDWADDRLIPDVVKAVVSGNKALIRNPHSTRPWQHVLEPLSGYLCLGKLLLEGNEIAADGWNFGPMNNETLKVSEVLNKIKQVWPSIDYIVEENKTAPHEASLLRLDCAKASTHLKWLPVWSMDKAIEKTAGWYKAFYNSGELLTMRDLESYVADAKIKELQWTL